MTIERIQLRRDNTANWATANPILSAGEPAFDTQLETLRIGNGTDHYLDLPPIAAGAAGGVYVQSSTPTSAVPALWVKTNIGGDPTKFALLFTDGT